MLIRTIALTNFLSFGSSTEPLELLPLNVLIGPNGSGKSNLIEAISLLQAAPVKIAEPIRLSGGVQDWLWRGDPEGTATVDVTVDNPNGKMDLRHVIEFRQSGYRFEISGERIENERIEEGEKEPYHYYLFSGHGHPFVSYVEGLRRIAQEDVQPGLSILAQRRGPEYPEISHLADIYKTIRIYRDWVFGRKAPARDPQATDLDNQYLDEDFLNLGMLLNRFCSSPRDKQNFLEAAKTLYPEISDMGTSISAGKVQVFFHEGNFMIPASRLSDGTLRWLCLLAILLNPAPPALVCIEEPELGLHPDVLPYLADLLKRASERMQLIVTTHSDVLVDAFTDSPRHVIVCEKHEGQTIMKRLSAEKLTQWLEKYTLGQLWSQGELGGNRW